MRLRLSGAAFVLLAMSIRSYAKDPVTFHKDVEPILQRNCQTCHRPGQIAPMSLVTYPNVRPWAKAIKEKVVARTMPPWFADPRYGPYVNDRSLKAEEIDTIAQWVDSGAPEGDSKDAPAPVQWASGWFIKPDIIVDGPTTPVPAAMKNNVMEWMTVVMPTGFTKDTWVTSVQIKPDFPEVTHHICISYVPHRAGYKYGVSYWTDKDRDTDGSALPNGPTFLGPGIERSSDGNPVRPPGGAEDCYLPGNFAADYRLINAAKLIPAGADITFNLHYTPNGKAVTDHVKVGFTVSEKPPARRYISFLTTSPTDPKRFAIPPNTANWESPPAEVTFLQDAELVYLMPHMHVRGAYIYLIDLTFVRAAAQCRIGQFPPWRRHICPN